MVARADYLIVGSGIVGLTIAREITTRFPEASVIILEKESYAGAHASGRNSGVMHSGIYYDKNTLKAKVCSDGARRMRAFAEEHKIAHSNCGKVIIATSEKDLPTIDKLMANAAASGIGAEKLDEAGVKALEPHASPYKMGISSPDTFVIDSKAVLVKLQEQLAERHVEILFDHPVTDIQPEKRMVTAGGAAFEYGYLFNCAGASADRIAKPFGLGTDYTLVPFKGMYYQLRPERAHLVNANIYPVPDIDLPFLGVHLTRVINGNVYVGPTAIPAFGRENYGKLAGIKLGEGAEIIRQMLGMYRANQQNFRALVHGEMLNYLKPYFVKRAQKLMHELTADDLIPCDKVGIRPQLVHTQKNALQMDYIIEQTDSSLHVLNAISPAFTSSLAFAELLVDRATAPTSTMAA